MSRNYQSRFEEALRVRDEGRFLEAEQMLSELAKEDPGNLAITLARAGVLFKMNNFSEAAQLFGDIIRSQPSTELASRGLFHSLWKMGRYDEAFEEMKRFLSMADSEAYFDLLSDLRRDEKG